jgi:uncharacterized membrane protein YeaQ/YmgE (transglycosylase-associated protein family)
MNTTILILAGAGVGWAGCAFLGWNQERGVIVSMLIGAFGAFIGAKMLAPMFTAAPIAGAFSVSALFFAVAVAAAFLAGGNLVQSRWGV